MKLAALIAAVAAAAAVLPAASGGAGSQPRIVFRTVQLSAPRRPPAVYSGLQSGAGRRLLALAADQPAWSPNRKRIAFAGPGYGARSSGIWLMNADGTGKRRLTARAGDGEPTWSPDGRRIAYRSNGDIWVAATTGGRPLRLFGGSATNEVAPDWSPDGTRLAYESNRGGEAQIWILTIKTRGVRRLTSGPASHQPDWSPDGRRIAYSTLGRIAVAPADGSVRRLLATGLPHSAYYPAWSPDGSRIAFERGGQVLTMRSSGGDLRYVTRAAWGTNGGPDW